jgi:hypothetical protein
MPAYDHHFMPLEPAPATDEECLALVTLGTINFDTKSGHALVVRFLGTNIGVSVIATTIPEATSGHADQDKWLRQIMETSLTAIRLTYDQAAQPVYTSDGFLNLLQQTDDPNPNYRFPIKRFIHPEFRVNIRNVLGVFGAIHGPLTAPVAALLADAQYPSTPPHYAVLSLVRALELLWPEDADRDNILAAREDEFAALKLSTRPFRNALPEIRNRCAHGHSRGRTKPDPYVGVGYNNPLRPLVRLLLSIVARGLNERGVEVVERAPMERTIAPGPAQ